MRKVKPLSEYQKGIYGEILSEFFNPIFSTGTTKSLKSNDLVDFLTSNSDTSLPLNASGAQNSSRQAKRQYKVFIPHNPKINQERQRDTQKK